MCGVSRATIVRREAQLLDLRLIEVEPEHRDDGQWPRNRYTRHGLDAALAQIAAREDASPGAQVSHGDDQPWRNPDAARESVLDVRHDAPMTHELDAVQLEEPEVDTGPFDDLFPDDLDEGRSDEGADDHNDAIEVIDGTAVEEEEPPSYIHPWADGPFSKIFRREHPHGDGGSSRGQ
jgi:hypothetical protein